MKKSSIIYFLIPLSIQIWWASEIKIIQRQSKQSVIQVEDNGIGIPKNQLAMILIDSIKLIQKADLALWVQGLVWL